MKIKTRLFVAFLTITVLPVVLILGIIFGLGNYQMSAFQKNYGLSDKVEIFSSNSMQTFNRLTQGIQNEIKADIRENRFDINNKVYLDNIDASLNQKYSYLIVRSADEIIYSGRSGDDKNIVDYLPDYGEVSDNIAGGIYLDGDQQHLIKQIDFKGVDGTPGSVFIISKVDYILPEVKSMLREMLLSAVLVLIIIGLILTYWVYSSLLRPLNKLQEAAKKIKDGNLDFTLEAESDDEIGQVCQDFEDMRIRLKESAEEKIQYDKDNKELISNITHDLKTPITAIKGYVEGIMDGVASSPEKLDKYIKTIYNKTNEMDRLINELTYYTQIDTNKIPYTFSKINVSEYFRDCVEEVGLDMESKNIELGFFNYVDKDVVVIADAEQLKKVINNIIGNSVKYIDKEKGIINIKISDVGDFIQVGIKDNGKGIAAKDLPNIFDRFYRTDSSRNSAKGGSGIGLSIVRKIIEDHGGRIWATSKEGIGTEVHFVLRKYTETAGDVK